MIDLHVHTTASDGRCTPETVVRRAAAVNIRVLSVTDHDTMAGVAPAAEAARTCDITLVPGIEITCVEHGYEVHLLAYFVQESAPGLKDVLVRQRRQRTERAREIADRLRALGVPVDLQPLLDAAHAPGGKSLARPTIAQALVTAGHVQSIQEAFDRFLADDRPAYVPHRGTSPADVVALVAAAGGVSSLAHPGYRPRDHIIPALVDAGLTAIEVYHSSHDTAAEAHYREIARRHALLVTGGSDFHGDGTRRAEFFGVTHLPEDDFLALLQRVSCNHLASRRRT